MALIGNIEQFNPKMNEISSYIERLEELFKCNGITTEEKKVSLLLTLIGGESYESLKNLVAPALPSEKTYSVLIGELKKHYSPKRLIIADRYKFHSAYQEDHEDIKSFTIRLKNLAKFCDFGSFLNDSLRDRLVCGIKSENVKRRLLTEEGLTFEKAYSIAISTEVAVNQLKTMGPESVNKLQYRGVNKPRKFVSVNKKQNQNEKYQDSSRKYQQKHNRCKRCTRSHIDNSKCPAINWKCYACQQIGHTAKSVLCKSKIHKVEDELEDSQTENSEEDLLELGHLEAIELNTNAVGKEYNGESHRLHSLDSNTNGSVKVKLCIENKYVLMEIDSGACKSVIHVNDYEKLFSHVQLKPVDCKLKVVTGENVSILGQIIVSVNCNDENYMLPLIILNSKSSFIPLLGRNWLSVFNPNWRNLISKVIDEPSSSLGQLESNLVNDEVKRKNHIISLKKSFSELFSNTENSSIKHFKVDLKLKEGTKPVFHRAYQMPYALKSKVETELMSMVNSGVLTKVNHSRWASPIVVVPKRNSNEIRICVDFKKTLNQVIDTDHCVLPLPEDIYASLSGNQYFSVIDLKAAYQQLEIGESSKELFTINTHLGLFRYNRLTYGVSSAPAIFQSIMESILAGLANTQCYLDDILVYGSTLEQCHKNVVGVLSCLKSYNVKVNEQKCKFYETYIEFLGHKIDAEGIHPTNEKIQCIIEAPTPQNLTQLRSYLGLLNYYGKFIPMLSAKLKPLYDLSRSGTEFKWNSLCEQTFQMSKNLITSSSVLTHYNPKLPIYITCDASSYGVGAVLSHIIDNEEKPVLFASSTLSQAEQKYSNLERESLAIIFSLRKFHKYVYGRKFTLITDHQPLQFIFGKNKGIPVTAAARIVRWALTLSAYNYDIQYKKGKLISNADGLSRIPMFVKNCNSTSIFSFNLMNTVPLNSEDIAKATGKDQLLIKVIDFTLSGWPNHIIDDNLKPFFLRRHDLSTENSCLMIGNKVVIPETLRLEILKLFHEQHVGIVRTKMLMRAYCWWPKINEDIEKFISSCEICQENQNFTNCNNSFSWPTAINAFHRVHIDFYHIYNCTFLILIDSNSKWIDIKLMSNGTNANETIVKLKEVFSVYGLPVQLVSDNGPPFNSSEFNAFCQANGIQPVKSPPYHPKSNGNAERSVQTVKKGMKKALFFEKGKEISKNLILSRLMDFLFMYRNTPCTTTGRSPAEALFKIKPRTRFDLIKPNSDRITIQYRHNKAFDRKTQLYSINDSVYVKNIQTKLWQKGKIVKIISYATYLVQIGDSIKFIHLDDMRKNPYSCNIPMSNYEQMYNDHVTTSIETVPNLSNANVKNSTNPGVLEVTATKDDKNKIVVSTTKEITEQVKSDTPRTTRFGRSVRPPTKLDL